MNRWRCWASRTTLFIFGLFNLIPGMVHLFQRSLFEIFATGGKMGFDSAEAPFELVYGPAQGILRTQFEEAAGIDQGEEQVAEFFFQVRDIAALARLAQLGEFFFHLVERALNVAPVKTYARYLGLDALGPE